MRQISKNIEKDGSGKITLIPESEDDLCCLSSIITVGDLVRTVSTRKVSKTSNNDSTLKFKTLVKLTLRVESVDYYPGEESMRVSGKNVYENQFVQVGQYHSHDICVHREFSIVKKFWESHYLKLIDEACNPSKSSDVAALMIQEGKNFHNSGLANLFLINKFSTMLKSRIKQKIPRKNKGFVGCREKAINSFYQSIGDLLVSHVDFDVVKCIIVGGPGFHKEHFLKFIQYHTSDKYVNLVKNKSKFLIAQTSTAFRRSLNEIMNDQKFVSKLENTKALEEIKLLHKFFEIISVDPCRAYYGLSHVRKASEESAIKVLLITDDILKTKIMSQRREYFKIMEDVKENGGTVHIFSSLHESGNELNQYSGLAAILRYPVEEIESIPMDDITSQIESLGHNS